MVTGGSSSSAGHLLDQIDALIERIGIPSFVSLDIAEADYPILAQAAVNNGSNDSNPRPMNEADYLSILEDLS